MATFFHILAFVAVAAAAVSWGAAVRGGLRAIAADRAEGRPPRAATRLLLLAWPFAIRPRGGSDAEAHAAYASKATVAFFVAITLAITATSLYTNLSMKRITTGPAGAPPAAPATPPSKS